MEKSQSLAERVLKDKRSYKIRVAYFVEYPIIRSVNSLKH